MPSPRLLLMFMTLLFFTVTTTSFAIDEPHRGTGIGNYDPVAYFTDGKAVVGNDHHVAMFRGVTYYFISKNNQEIFAADSEKYVPAYDGYCAYAVAFGQKVEANPQVWKIVRGTLYLNVNADVQQTWEKDISGNIMRADEQWEQIQDIAPGDL